MRETLQAAAWSDTRRRALTLGALVLLSLMATGWTAFERGLFQDDAQVLFRVLIAPDGVLSALTMPITSATRRLQGSPYAVALASGEPLLALRVAGEVMTLAIGLTGAALARHALHLGPAGAFVAGALIVTATSDWLTASLVALGYNLAILFHLVGALGLVRWAREGRSAWLGIGLMAGIASLWTVDAAATVHPVTPVLAWLACEDAASRRRLAMASVAWLLSATPYYLHFWSFLTNPDSYAAQAIVASSWSERLARCADLVAYNFTPWRWAFGRRNWFLAPSSTMPMTVGIAVSSLSLVVVGWILARLHAGERPSAPVARRAGRDALMRLALLLGFTVLANATFMAVHLSEFRYRTQLLSRVWASLALAAVFGIVWARGSARSRVLAATLVMTFLWLGLMGGFERQVYFASYFQRHRIELGSIADAIPKLLPTSNVVLRLPPHDLYTATDAPYLARAWVTLLGADPSLECRTFLVSPVRDTRCEPGPRGLVCRGDRSPRCAGGGGDFDELPYDRLVVLTYDPASNVYRLEPRLPPDLVPAGSDAETARTSYSPAAQVVPGPVSTLARDLLDR